MTDPRRIEQENETDLGGSFGARANPDFVGEVWTLPGTEAKVEQGGTTNDAAGSTPDFQGEVWSRPAAGKQAEGQVVAQAGDNGRNPFLPAPEKTPPQPAPRETPPKEVPAKEPPKEVTAPKPVDRTSEPIKADVVQDKSPFESAPKASIDAVPRALEALSGVEAGKELTPAQRKAFEDAIKDASSIDPKWAEQQAKKLTEELQSKERKFANGQTLPPWTAAKEEALWKHTNATDVALNAVPLDIRRRLQALDDSLKGLDIISRVRVEQQMTTVAREDTTGKASEYLKERLARNQFQKDNSAGIMRRNIHQQEMSLLSSPALTQAIYALAMDKAGQPGDTKKIQDSLKVALSNDFAVVTIPEVLQLKEKYKVKDNDPLDAKVPGRAALKEALMIMRDDKLSATERLEKARPLFEQAIGASDRLDVKKIDEELEKIGKEAAKLTLAGELQKLDSMDDRATELLEQRMVGGLARVALASALNDAALAAKGKDDAAAGKFKEDALKVLQSLEKVDPSSKYDPIYQGSLKLIEQGKKVTEQEALTIGKPIVDALKEEAKKQGKDPDADQPQWKQLLKAAGGLILSVVAFEAVRYGWNRTVGAAGSATRRAVEQWRRSANVEADKSLPSGEKPQLFLKDADGKEHRVEGVRREDGKLRIKNGDVTEITKVTGKLILKIPADSTMTPEQIKAAAAELLKPTSTEHQLDDAAKLRAKQQADFDALGKQNEELRRQLQGANEGLNEPSRRGLDLSRELKAAQAELKITSREQVTQLLRSTLDAIDELKGDKKWSEADRRNFETLIEEYGRGDAKAVAAVNKYLSVELPGTTTVESTGGSALPREGGQKELSLKDLERMMEAPEQRAKLVRDLIEKGPLRETLREAGMEAGKAQRLERDLLSDKKEVRERAQLEIARHYEGKGGLKGFAKEAKGRLGAAVLVAAALLPLIFVAGSDVDPGEGASWSGGRR